MKINFFSDLHLEWGTPCKVPETDADIVIAAGDIGTPILAAEFLKQIEKPVLYIAGNHEYYGGEWRNRRDKLEKHTRNSHVHFMDNDVFEFQGYHFFGATLWTDFNLYHQQVTDMLKAPKYMNDYHQIRFSRGAITPEFILHKHELSLEHLQNFLDKKHEKVVVVTHHLPSSLSIHNDYRMHPGNPFYASELTKLFREDMHWFHGHTHSTVEYECMGTYVHANPRGYVTPNRTENHEFDINKTVSL